MGNIENSTIMEINSNGVSSVFADASSGVDAPRGLAFDAAGNLYVANTGNNTIEKFTPNGVGTVFASTGLNQPWGLAFGPNGNLFVANYGNNTIEEFTSGGTGSLFASTSPWIGPSGLACDNAGDLYVSSLSNFILKFTPQGVESIFANVNVANPNGLALDAAGNVYVAEFNNSVIGEYATNGDYSNFGNVPLQYPTAVTVGSDSNLYATTWNGYVVKYNLSGDGSVFAYLGTDLPWSIAVIPEDMIPEPSPLSMLLLAAPLTLFAHWLLHLRFRSRESPSLNHDKL